MLALLGLSLAIPAGAGAYVYWAGGTIHRAGLDGKGADDGFVSGIEKSNGVAVGGGYIFWANDKTLTIGRADLDGSHANPEFIPAASKPYGVATDGVHVYWANYEGGTTIGRANVDGTDVDQSFISGLSAPSGVAVDGHHVYWVAGSNIGRANLDGTSPEPEFIKTGNTSISVAVDAHHLYWTNYGGNAIGRANLDGSEATASFIPGAEGPIAIGVDDKYVYWTNLTSGRIGRANLDGTASDQSFMTVGGQPFGLAVDSLPHGDAATLSCQPATAILGKSATCTTTVDDTGPFSAASGALFSTGIVSLKASGAGGFSPAATCNLTPTATTGVAACLVTFAPTAIGGQTISAAYPGDTFHLNPASATTNLVVKPQNAFTLGKPKLNRHTGGATLLATLPGPGSLALKGKGIKSKTVKVAKAGKVTLVVKPTGKLLAKLKAAGKAKSKARVTFTPSGGDPLSKTLKLRLARAG